MKKLFFTLSLFVLAGTINAQEISNQDVRFDQYGKIVQRTPLAAEMRNGILVFESKNQDYKLWFDIRVQTDAQAIFGDDLNPMGNGASIRRARFAAKANLTKNWYGEIDLDFANGILELNDAIIGYDFLNGLSTRVGNFKERFSMSQTASSRYLNFMERAMVVTAFAPSRHIGWEVAYSGKKFVAVGGIFFQEIEDAEMRVFSEDNNKDFGYDEGVSYAGKFVYQPFTHKKDLGLHLAAAYSYRTPKTSVDPGEYGGFRYNTRSLSSINRKKFLDTDLIPNLDHEQRTNFEIAGWYKGFGVQSEIINNWAYITDNTDPYKFGGFYVQGVALLFGGKQCYIKSEAEFTQPDRGKKWGDVELAFRYDHINLNNRDVYGGSADGYTFGLNFYAAKNFKCQLNYNYLNHDRYANGKGKLYVGHDVEGILTKDPTKVAELAGKAGNDYSMLGVRFEIDF